MEPFRNRKIKVILINLFLTLTGVTILLLVFEHQFRSKSETFEIAWPAKHQEGVGWIFEPHSTIKWTNHSTFWQKTKANEMGFLDRPRVSERHSSEFCNIVFLGDSFVETAQVPIEKKAHVILESLAKEDSNLKNIRTSAFGYSGTGQVSQRPFFDNFIIPIKPDLLIMIVVSNDFSDNSPILSSVRNGWHPDFPPRPFYNRNEHGQLKYRMDHPDWRKKLLKTPPLSSFKNLAIWEKIGINFANRYNVTDPIIESRVRQILSLKLSGHVTGGIESIKTHLDIDYRMREDAVDEEAIKITAGVFDYYKKIAEKIGTEILIVYNHEIVEDKSNQVAIAQANQRRSILLNIGNNLNIPVKFLDGGDFISNEEIGKLFLKNDGHWSIEGHKFAARTILSSLLENKAFCENKDGGLHNN